MGTARARLLAKQRILTAPLPIFFAEHVHCVHDCSRDAGPTATSLMATSALLPAAASSLQCPHSQTLRDIEAAKFQFQSTVDVEPRRPASMLPLRAP